MAKKRISIGAKVRALGRLGKVVGNGGSGDWIVEIDGKRYGCNERNMTVVEEVAIAASAKPTQGDAEEVGDDSEENDEETEDDDEDEG